jgi:hypothetical protein
MRPRCSSPHPLLVGGRPNVFREHHTNWDKVPGNLDDLGEWDIAGLERGKASVFRGEFRTWDEIQGNIDDLGEWDTAGAQIGTPKVLKTGTPGEPRKKLFR